ncbi:MAG TPA: transglycosylase SLT domain-containing protein [Pyrinomonadaceae bacterium]
MLSLINRKSTIITCALLALLSITGQAQNNSAQIRAAVEANDWTTARAELEKLRTTDSSLFHSKDYDYLLGRIAEKTADLTTATTSFQIVAASKSQLGQYADWHLAQIARATGDLVLEREKLRRILSLATGSLLYDAASLRLANSFYESGDYAATITAARVVSTSKNIAVAREGSLLMAQALEKNNKLAEARDVFNRLVMQVPDAARPDDFALAAVRELDELAKRTDLPTTPLSEADHLLRASIYQFNRDFAGARVHYQAVVDANPKGGTAPNALYQIGRGLYLEYKYEDAIKYFNQVVSDFPQSQSARDALGQLAASYLRLKRIDDTVAAYKQLLANFPEGPNPERTYLNIIDAYHEAGRYPEALNWIQQTRARFKNDLGSSLALFAQLRIHLAQSAWSDVVRDADELTKMPDLGGTRVGGGTTPQEVAFLRSYALEQLGRNEEAITGYLAITDGRNEYYGDRSTQRLRAMNSPAALNRFNSFMAAAKSADTNGQFDQARVAAQNALRLTQDPVQLSQLYQILKRAYGNLPNYKLQSFNLISLGKNDPSADAHQLAAERLLELGLYDEAIPELIASRASGAKSANAQSGAFTDDGYTVATYSLRGGLANRAVRFGEQFWKTVPADYVIEVAPRDLIELLYPVPFKDSLLKHPPAKNVDPRFVLAITRQESRYQVDVKSVSAARGMMQFIAATANDIAAQLQLKDFTQDELYSPDTAILFGSQYLSNLFQQFPNQPQAVAGSYNGGADNLARWIARSHSNEADRYVPEIGYSQTKDYVYKVLANYWNYQRLYDAQLQPLSQ